VKRGTCGERACDGSGGEHGERGLAVRELGVSDDGVVLEHPLATQHRNDAG
jgi:hypothetical protein